MTVSPSSLPLMGVAKPDLPICGYKQDIIDSVLHNDVTIISSETGSGKSTQVPQFLLSAKHRFKRPREGKSPFKICITQPRRVAAISLAKRVSSELGEKTTGETVGYRVRFEESMSSKTSICFLTDGMLVREAVNDSGTFSNYSVVVLDEVHERSLHTDLLIGLISRAIQERRSTGSPLKVVIMSATLSVDMFQTFFRSSGASVKALSIPGRTFPVSIWYTPEVEHDYVEASVCTIVQINEDYHSQEGDILVFLPGQDDIEAVSASLIARSRQPALKTAKELVIVHLFAALSNEAQSIAFNPVSDPVRSRKVVLATNIAETSLTIPGIRFVVDCGLVKMKSMINSQLEVLRITPASKATVIQRTGRAGREKAGGQCFRLYRELDYEQLVENSLPEIVRCDMSSSLLQIHSMQIVGPSCIFKSISEFPFIDKPSDQSISRAELVLKRIGALSASGITESGKVLSSFPLHPLLGNILVNSREFNCVPESLILVSLLSVDNLWYNQKNGGSRGNSAMGDHWNLIEVFKEMKKISSLEERATLAKRHGMNPNAFSKACKIESQLSKLFGQKFGCPISGSDTYEDRNVRIVKFQRLLAKSLWLNCAKLVTRKTSDSSPVAEYETLDRISCFIHPGSSLFGLKDPPQCVVYTEITQTTRNYMRGVTAIDGNWLVELVPNYFKSASGSNS